MIFTKAIAILFCAVMASAVTAQNLIPHQYVLGNTFSTLHVNTFVDDNGDYYLFASANDFTLSPSPGNLNVPGRGTKFFFVSKHNENHDVIWRQSYGGDSLDNILGAVQVQDGFLVSCYSNSPISGTKTVASNGQYHQWVQKIDFDGNVLWQRGYYTDNDVLYGNIYALNNNEFIISTSTQAGISGDKTSFGYDGEDCWLIKIDADGEILADYTYGTYDGDYGFDVAGQFSNNDILLSMASSSNTSGDKTEDNYGEINLWLLRVSSQTGEIVWDKTIGSDGEFGEYGGPLKIENDTIYIMTSSDGGISGLRTVPQKGDVDIWFLKLDQNANIIEQKAYGGNYSDAATNMFFEENGNLLVLASSSSNTSIDKSEDCRGIFDIWLLKIDAFGNILTQKTIGGNHIDGSRRIVKLNNGNYLMSGNSRSDVSGEKTVPRISSNSNDLWVLELDAVTLNVVSNNIYKNEALLYPNPTTNQINLSFNEPTQLTRIVLHDLSGKVVWQQAYQSVLESNYTFSTAKLSPGVYTLRMEGVGFVKTQQVVVK